MDRDREQWLLDARESEAKGDFESAIEAYTAANRAQADSRVERALVKLRRQAFVARRDSRRFERVDERAVAPANAPIVALDPALGLPVAHGAVDAPTLRTAIEGHGSLLVRGLLSRDQTALLREATIAANAARTALVEGKAASASNGDWYHEFEGDPDSKTRDFTSTDGVLAADSPRGLFHLLEVFREAGLDRLSRDFLGETPVLSVEKSVLRRVTPQWAASWHQDGAFLGERIRTLDVWIALTPCGVNAPGLELLPRRVNRVLPTGAFFSWDLSWEVIGREFPGFTTVHPVFEPGDAILFDQLCVHRSGHREGMTEARLAVECWLFAASEVPAEYTGLAL